MGLGIEFFDLGIVLEGLGMSREISLLTGNCIRFTYNPERIKYE